MVPGALSLFDGRAGFLELCFHHSFTSDWVVLLLWLFSYFLAMFVCSFGFWLPGLFFRSVEICRDQFFQFASTALEKLGRLTALAGNGLVLVAAVASCRLLSLFPC
ncbi:hypothetical protein QL285_073131 [Trifolium repens]|nr:hypothetical protein QL285_073131 [Trifolium repens]